MNFTSPTCHRTPTPVSYPTYHPILKSADLWAAMERHNTHIVLKGVAGILQSVQREDGSGRCFNVEILAEGVYKHVFVRF